MVVDAPRNRLLYADCTAGALRAMDTKTGVVTTLLISKSAAEAASSRWALDGLSYFYSVSIDPVDRALLVGCRNGIIRLDEKTHAYAVVAGNMTTAGAPTDGVGPAAQFDSIPSLAIHTNGTIYAADCRAPGQSGGVRKCTRVASAQTPGGWLLDVKTTVKLTEIVSMALTASERTLVVGHRDNSSTTSHVAIIDVATGTEAGGCTARNRGIRIRIRYCRRSRSHVFCEQTLCCRACR
jgi:hypothetical protein